MSLPISDGTRASTTRPTTAPPKAATAAKPAAKPAVKEASAPSATNDTASVSSESRRAGSTDNATRTSAAASRSLDAIGKAAKATATHATAGPKKADDEKGGAGLGAIFGAASIGAPKLEGHPGQIQVGEALESGEPGTLTNSNGDEVEFGVEQGEGSDTHEAYTVSLGEDQVNVNIPPGENAEEVLARVTDFYSQQPENARGAVDNIVIEPGQNPDDAYWAKEYNSPDFTSAATGGGGTITFWNGSEYLREGAFGHEFGHNIGSAVREEQNDETPFLGRFLNAVQDAHTGDNKSTSVPRGYSQAAANDNKSISEYGDNAIGEDFAETWMSYNEAAQAGPQALQAFAKQYPERYSLIVNEVLSRDLDVAA